MKYHSLHLLKLKNGSTQTYNENSGIMNKSVIDLKNITMTGVDLYVGEDVIHRDDYGLFEFYIY
jgi:hypothetical protein